MKIKLPATQHRRTREHTQSAEQSAGMRKMLKALGGIRVEQEEEFGRWSGKMLQSVRGKKQRN